METILFQSLTMEIHRLYLGMTHPISPYKACAGANLFTPRK